MVVPIVPVLMAGGFHVPLMPFVETVGSIGGVLLYWHTGLICVKVGAVGSVMRIVSVAVFAHWPASGVKV